MTQDQDFLVIIREGNHIIYCNETVQTLAEQVTGLAGLIGVRTLIDEFALTGLSEELLIEPLPIFNRHHEFTLSSLQKPMETGKDTTVRLKLFEHIVEDNGVRYAVLQGRDVSEDQRVHIERDVMETVFKSTHDAVVITDAANKIVAVNHAMERVSGFSEAELLGKNPNFMSSGRHDSAFYDSLWLNLNTDGKWEGTLWDRRKNGEIYPRYTSISVIHDQNKRIVNYVMVFRDESDIHKAEAKVRHLTHYDQLTGLANRSLLLERLNWAILRAERNGTKVAVLITGLDGFRQINDGMGHVIGDDLIMQSADRLQKVSRQVDMLARIGGDEFAIVMEDSPAQENIERFAERINEATSEPIYSQDRELHISSSLGISVYPDDASDGGELVRLALLAQQHVKKHNRGRHAFYDQSMNDHVETRLELEADLRNAIENEQLVLHFQPKMSLADGKVRGVEALVRWDHPTKGLVAPDLFIPYAEESGLIIPLGRYVLEKACEQIAQWRAETGEDIPVAVNLSPRQLHDQELLSDIMRILKAYNIPPELLEIELTETLVMDRADENISLLKQLQGLGIRIAVDDFGTGYSSLSYLKKLPVDNLKIDRSFISGIPNDDDDEMIVLAMVTMAQNMKLKVVAEGVETPEQMEFLRKVGCTDAQGYHISRPVPAKDVLRLIEKVQNTFKSKRSGATE